MSSDKAIISFEHVYKYYDNEGVLLDFNLDIYEGEFVTVIGTSGSGKTTTLKLINGLLRADKGKIIVKGEDLNNLDIIKLRRNIGYVIQDVGLFPHMNVEKNISYVLNLEKNNKEKTLDRVKYLMDIVQLDLALISRYPRELSGGEKQRVGIARALASDPDIILMDEPFGAVDEITRKTLQDEIIRIQQKLNKTIFFITHDIKEAFKVGSKIIIMNEGKIIQIGTTEEIKKNPKNSFVESLIESVI